MHIGKTLVGAAWFAAVAVVVAPLFAGAQDAPTLTVSLDSSTPVATTVAQSQTNVSFAAIRVSGGAAPASINGIQVASDSPNASSNVYNVKIYDGADLVASTFLSSLADFNGVAYYTWFDLTTPIFVPANGTKIFTIVASILPQGSGKVRLGIAGLNFILPGAYVNGLPVYGNSMNIVSAPTPSGPAITVLSPNGGETWTVGQLATITWRRNWMPSGANGLVDITVRRESAPSSQVIAGGAADSAGFSFVVPSWFVPANDYRIFIGSWGMGGSVTAPLGDESDGTFRVVAATPPAAVPTITLLSPTRGEYVNRGGPYTVRWSTSGTLPADSSMLLYLVHNIVSLGRISSSAISASLNSYVWDTSAYFLETSGAARATEAGSGYQIKAVLTSSGNMVTTALSEQFSLADQLIRSVSVGVPNGGEQWQQGSVQTIQWGSSNVYEVIIYLLRGSSIVWTIADIATNPSQYRWTIPGDISDGSDYRIRVVDPSSGIFDDSDQPFTIAARQPGGAPLISDGSLFRSRGDYKVYITKGGYRRHITSARIFSFYGHLGFAQVIEVDPAILTRYTESDLVRAVGDPRVWQIDAAGKKHWLKMSGEQFLARGNLPNAVFDINGSERDFYRSAANITP